MGPALISARTKFVEVPEGLKLTVKKTRKGILFYWIPIASPTKCRERKSRKFKESGELNVQKILED